MTNKINKEYYEQIPANERHFIRLSQEAAYNLMDKLNAAGIPYSAVVGDYRNIITVSKADSERAEAFARESAPAVQSSGRRIIGNYEYKYISDKKYIKTDAETAMQIADILSGNSNMRFSGVIEGSRATITVSGDKNAATVRTMIDNIKNMDLIKAMREAGFERVADTGRFVNIRNIQTGETCGFSDMDAVRDMWNSGDSDFFTPSNYRIEYMTDTLSDYYIIWKYNPNNINGGSASTDTFLSVSDALEFARINGISVTNSDEEIERWRANEEAKQSNRLVAENTAKVEQFPTVDGNYPDHFIYDDDSQSITWYYFNPDGDDGNGTFIEKYIRDEDIFAAYMARISAENEEAGRTAFINYLNTHCEETTFEINDSNFSWCADNYLNVPGDVFQLYGVMENSPVPDAVDSFIDFAEGHCIGVIKDKEKREQDNRIYPKSTGLTIDGYNGTWNVVDTFTVDGEQFFELQSAEYYENTANIIVDNERNVVMRDVWGGIRSYRDQRSLDEYADKDVEESSGQFVRISGETAAGMWGKDFDVRSENGFNIPPHNPTEELNDYRFFRNPEIAFIAPFNAVRTYINASVISEYLSSVSGMYSDILNDNVRSAIFDLKNKYGLYGWSSYRPDKGTTWNILNALLTENYDPVESYIDSILSYFRDDSVEYLNAERALVRLNELKEHTEKVKARAAEKAAEEANKTPYERLLDLAHRELKEYEKSLDTVEKALGAAYELSTKREILMFIETGDLERLANGDPEEMINRFISEGHPLDLIYSEWLDNEYSNVSEAIEDTITDVVKNAFDMDLEQSEETISEENNIEISGNPVIDRNLNLIEAFHKSDEHYPDVVFFDERSNLYTWLRYDENAAPDGVLVEKTFSTEDVFAAYQARISAESEEAGNNAFIAVLNERAEKVNITVDDTAFTDSAEKYIYLPIRGEAFSEFFIEENSESPINVEFFIEYTENNSPDIIEDKARREKERDKNAFLDSCYARLKTELFDNEALKNAIENSDYENAHIEALKQMSDIAMSIFNEDARGNVDFYIDFFGGMTTERRVDFDDYVVKTLRQAIENREQSVPEFREVPLYTMSSAEALAEDELELYRISKRENRDCLHALDNCIEKFYNDNRLDTEAVLNAVFAEFPEDRVEFIIAANISRMNWDGRMSRENVEWAESYMNSYSADFKKESEDYILKSHPGLINLMGTEIHKYMEKFRERENLEALKARLIRKVNRELKEFLADTHSASKYQVDTKKDIADFISGNDNFDLTERQYNALLSRPHILSELYEEWRSNDIDEWDEENMITFLSETADSIADTLERDIENPALEQAKELITKYLTDELDLTPDFSDLRSVSIGYMEFGENDEYEYQADADLIDFKVTYYLNDEVIREENYTSLEEMIEKSLSKLNMPDFVRIGNDEIEGRGYDRISRALNLDHSNITFSVITIEDEKTFVVGDYIDEQDITDLGDYQEYVYEHKISSADVTVDFYSLGGNFESMSANDEEVEYISANLDEIISNSGIQHLETHTYSVETPDFIREEYSQNEDEEETVIENKIPDGMELINVGIAYSMWEQGKPVYNANGEIIPSMSEGGNPPSVRDFSNVVSKYLANSEDVRIFRIADEIANEIQKFSRAFGKTLNDLGQHSFLSLAHNHPEWETYNDALDEYQNTLNALYRGDYYFVESYLENIFYTDEATKEQQETARETLEKLADFRQQSGIPEVMHYFDRRTVDIDTAIRAWECGFDVFADGTVIDGYDFKDYNRVIEVSEIFREEGVTFIVGNDDLNTFRLIDTVAAAVMDFTDEYTALDDVIDGTEWIEEFPSDPYNRIKTALSVGDFALVAEYLDEIQYDLKDEDTEKWDKAMDSLNDLKKLLPQYLGRDSKTSYYYFPKGFSVDSLWRIRDQANSYAIAAPTLALSDEETERFHIHFYKIGRDIDRDYHNMRDKLLTLRERHYLETAKTISREAGVVFSDIPYNPDDENSPFKGYDKYDHSLMAELAAHDEIRIYQVKSGEEYHFKRFMDLEQLREAPNVDDYDLVYTGSLSDLGTDDLDELYTIFNINHPEDFKGHSLSVGDVLAFHGRMYYVNGTGFEQLSPDFFKERKSEEKTLSEDEAIKRLHSEEGIKATDFMKAMGVTVINGDSFSEETAEITENAVNSPTENNVAETEQTDSDIHIVTPEVLGEVIETREPREMFLAQEGERWVAVDNRTGDAWTEDFETKESAIMWLTDSELSKEDIIEEIAKEIINNSPMGTTPDNKLSFDDMKVGTRFRYDHNNWEVRFVSDNLLMLSDLEAKNKLNGALIENWQSQLNRDNVDFSEDIPLELLPLIESLDLQKEVTEHVNKLIAEGRASSVLLDEVRAITAEAAAMIESETASMDNPYNEVPYDFIKEIISTAADNAILLISEEVMQETEPTAEEISEKLFLKDKAEAYIQDMIASSELPESFISEADNVAAAVADKIAEWCETYEVDFYEIDDDFITDYISYAIEDIQEEREAEKENEEGTIEVVIENGDIPELRSHLANNGYYAEWDGNSFMALIDEIDYIETIMRDRDITYTVGGEYPRDYTPNADSRTDYEPKIGDMLEINDSLATVSNISGNIITFTDAETLFPRTFNMTMDNFLTSDFTVVQEKDTVVEETEEISEETPIDRNNAMREAYDYLIGESVRQWNYLSDEREGSPMSDVALFFKELSVHIGEDVSFYLDEDSEIKDEVADISRSEESYGISAVVDKALTEWEKTHNEGASVELVEEFGRFVLKTALENMQEEKTEEFENIKNLAQLKRILAVGAEFEMTSAVRSDVQGQLRRVNYADTTGIYTIRPDAPDDAKTTLANGGRGSYLAWGKSADWEFENGKCTLYYAKAPHIKENEVLSILVTKSVLEHEHSENAPEDRNAPDYAQQLAEKIDSELNESIYEAKIVDFSEVNVKKAIAEYIGNNAFDFSEKQYIALLSKTNLLDELYAEWSSGSYDGYSDLINSVAAAEEKEVNFRDDTLYTYDLNDPDPNKVKLRSVVIDMRPKAAREISGEIPAESEKSAKGKNFVITDDNYGAVGGAKSRYAANIAAIRTLKAIEAENRTATPEEQQILSLYTGWGAIPQVFDANNDKWEKEYAELKELLTPEEYGAARHSTMNAHYTSPTVISALYEGLDNLGFTKGNILEPAMGIGNFFGKLPESMNGSNLYGIELDSITGRIAQQLYPGANIQITGFEKTDFPDNSFDVAIGNVPFGDYKVNDRRYNDNNFLIHDYFFAKALDKVHPGGIIAFVTSKGTMDKENDEIRQYIAQRAEFLGAIRLPNNAFKESAGTEVTSDIIFLQKRDRPIEIDVDEVSWIKKGQTEDGLSVNKYFIDHPEMVLGRIVAGNKLYGNQEGTTSCIPIEGADLKQQLAEAIKNIQGTYRESELGIAPEDSESIPAPAGSRKFSYYAEDGKIYYREAGSMMKKVDFPKDRTERLLGMIELRDNVHELLNLQLNNSDGTLDGRIAESREKLNRKYEAFVKKYGNVSSKKNARAMKDDSGYNIVSALELREDRDDKEKVTGKADIFTKNTVKPKIIASHVDTAEEALILSVSEKGKVDFDFMTELCGMDKDRLITVLEGQIFKLPQETEKFVPADEYLSGNIRKKLRELENAPDDGYDYSKNREALERSMPPRVEAKDISVKLGAHWIDPSYVQQFIIEKLKPDWKTIDMMNVQYSTAAGAWKIEGVSGTAKNSYLARQTYGTKRKHAYEIIEAILNSSDLQVKDRVKDEYGNDKKGPDGKYILVINDDETKAVRQCAKLIQSEFKDWIFSDPDRREKLVQRYNEVYNSIRLREYDGSHLNFVGMNTEITLKEHQKNAVARGLYGGNTMLAHAVGAGKSATRS